MFTGIIEEQGTIKDIKRGAVSCSMTISASKVLEDTQIGDSIATNGVCLTVTSMDKTSYTCDVMAETLRRSGLGSLKPGDRVNLERALAVGGRLGGHIVSGHIDGTGRIRNFQKEENAVWVTIETEKNILKYIVEKGSVALDGISLTVAYVDDECFKVSVIPHTGEETGLLSKKPGDIINIENDIIGKYVEKLLKTADDSDDGATGASSDKSMLQRLTENGFM